MIQVQFADLLCPNQIQYATVGACQHLNFPLTREWAGQALEDVDAGVKSPEIA